VNVCFVSTLRTCCCSLVPFYPQPTAHLTAISQITLKGYALSCGGWHFRLDGMILCVFGRQEGSLSRIFITTMYKIMAFRGHLLQFDPRRLQHRLQEWAAAIAAHPAGIDPLLCIALFIDGNDSTASSKSPPRRNV